jgi:hypothetical protein
MSRAERRSVLQRAYAAKQQCLIETAQKLSSRASAFNLLQAERSAVGTAAVVKAILQGEDAFCFPNAGRRAFTESLRTRLKRQSYEPAVTGALRDALELDSLHNTIVTLEATSTERYADFM